jgi:hypothetical protein
MIGSRKEKKTNVYAVRLAGWLMKKEEKKKNREVMIHKRFFLVCVCGLSRSKNALRENREKGEECKCSPVFLSSNTSCANLQTHQRERIQQGK